jgi:diguanylate cyclase (GGDEF)-like protein
VASPQWATQQLTELLADVAALPEPATVEARAVEHAAEALECEVAALVRDGEVVHSLGFPSAAVPAEVLAQLAVGGFGVLEVPGVGACAALSVPSQDGSRLLVARVVDEPFSGEERALLRGMAQVLGLALQGRQLLDEERTSRALTEAHAAVNAELLVEVQERQALLERLSRIQRSISSRKPLQEVLDSIVAGAAELLGDEVVALRLVDPDDPSTMVLASTLGVPDVLVAGMSRQPVGEGVGGQAIVEDRLVHTDDYAHVPSPIPEYVEDRIRSVMAAPVRQGDRAVGSLTVATRRPDRQYSTSEQEALTAFAEHVSLALNDAQAVQALHQAVVEATHSSLHDSLTGLPNRALFLDRLAHAGERSARRGGRSYSVLFIDVDDFKVVNDSLGHLVGDQLLTAVAARVQSQLRSQDTVARLGGDEFAVLLEESQQDDAVAAAERVLRCLSAPFHLPGGSTVHVGASIGLVTGSGPLAPQELLRDADVAMYRAKGEGKNRCTVFEPAMRDRLQARTELEAELRVAVHEQHLVVHHQPVVDAATGRVISTEALVRWEHPRRGLVPPSEFIPVAEDTGLIVDVGRVVLQAACAATARWRRLPGLADLTVSVNLSPRQLQEPSLVPGVAQALAASGLPPEALVLEITESLLVTDVPEEAERLDALKALGVRLAVDDFGTGYSSLSYLSRLPVDILKVDKSFVAGLDTGTSAGKLAGAVLALASSLGLETIAEGVETPEQAAALLELGCTRLQGYLYSRPVPPAAVPATLQALGSRLQVLDVDAPLVPPARVAGVSART